MKILNAIMPAFMAILFFGCSSTTAKPPHVKEPPAWFQIEPGMTMGQVHALLGQSQESTEVRDVYRAEGHWELTVGYGRDGKVISVVDLQKNK